MKDQIQEQTNLQIQPLIRIHSQNVDDFPVKALALFASDKQISHVIAFYQHTSLTRFAEAEL